MEGCGYIAMITEITNPLLVPKILDLAKSIDSFPLEKLKSMLTEGFKRQDTRLVVYKKDEELKGFVYATIDFFDGDEVVFIQASSIDSKEKNIGYELLANIKKWGNSNNCKYIYMITQRDKAFERKYKFEPIGTVMRREI